MYRALSLEVVGADDAQLTQPIYGPRKMAAYQVLDQECATVKTRVGTADVEALVSIAPVTTGYFICITSDYPVKVRLNNVAGTQFTLTSNNVAATSAGAPLPDMCVWAMTGLVTSVYLAPITAATQTANVKILVTGDPTNAYT